MQAGVDMENAVLFFDDFAFAIAGISDCLFAETEGKKTVEEVGMFSIFLTVIF